MDLHPYEFISLFQHTFFFPPQLTLLSLKGIKAQHH